MLEIDFVWCQMWFIYA